MKEAKKIVKTSNQIWDGIMLYGWDKKRFEKELKALTLTTERDELKLKEKERNSIQFAKQVAENAYQKCCNERDELKGMVLEADSQFVKIDKKNLEDQTRALEVNDKLNKELQTLKDLANILVKRYKPELTPGLKSLLK